MVPVPEQQHPDGSFPTVAFPNPEEPGALDLAYRTAEACNAALIIAHDPDADRLAIALPHSTGYRALTGNQLGLLLGWRMAERFVAHHDPASGTLACTIVSSPALAAVAKHYGLGYRETLSGFKWVSRVPGLVFGFEEALGYLVHPQVVSDKDGISASAEVLAWAAELAAEGRTLWDALDDAYTRFGYFASDQVVVRLASAAAVAPLAERIRANPPQELGGIAVDTITDLQQPGAAAVPANVLRFDFVDGSRLMIRPSGTEPKLKLYLDTHSTEGTPEERRSRAEGTLTTLVDATRTYLAALGDV